MTTQIKRITSTALSLLILMSIIFATPVSAKEVTTTPQQAVVDIALGEVGNGEYSSTNTKYNRWYGTYCAWCCIFVSWCANEMDLRAGTNAYGNIFPRTATCQYSLEWYEARGLYKKRSSGYVPKAGDLIYFDWSGKSARAGHIGIVKSVTGNKVNQVSGNFGKKVAEYSYNLNDTDIMGYATPDYGAIGTEITLDSSSTTPKDVDESIEEYTATGKTTENLIVRTGPSITYDKISTLPKGTGIEIVGKFSTGWYKIKYSGSYGYVSASYVTLDSDTTVPPTESTVTATSSATSDNTQISSGITTANLNLRTGPSTANNILTVIPKNSTVAINSKLSAGWYSVKYGSFIGYVSASYIKTVTENTEPTTDPTTELTTESTTESTTLKPSTSEPATTTDINEITLGTTSANLNLRSKPSTSGKVLLVIPKGAKITVYEELSSGWHSVKYGNYTGYVSGTYVNIAGSNTTAAKPTTATITQNTTDDIILKGYTSANLNVRKSPSTSSTVFGILPKGANVEIFSKQTVSGTTWYKIKYAGNDAYICGTYVKLATTTTTSSTTTTKVSTTSTTQTTASTTTTTTDQTTTPPQKVSAKTTANLNLRTKPSTSSKVTLVIPKNSSVIVLEKVINSNWYQVQYGNYIGYVFGDYLNF